MSKEREVPTEAESTIGSSATGASEAEVKDALLASEVSRCTLTGHQCGSDTVAVGLTCPDERNKNQCIHTARPISPAAEQGKDLARSDGRQEPDSEADAGGYTSLQLSEHDAMPHSSGFVTAGTSPIALASSAYLLAQPAAEGSAGQATSGYVQTGEGGEGPSCHVCGAVMVQHVIRADIWICGSCGATTGATRPTEGETK